MWNNFEHQVWQKIKHHDLQNKKLFLAVSGGVDSMALVHVLAQLKLNSNLTVLHYHHGDGQNKIFRDDSLELVRKLCSDLKIVFVSDKATKELKSESEFREARRVFFQKNTENGILVTGHHLDDVLETRLIKMIRGTGAAGLTSFVEYNYKIFRPFLSFSKKQIVDYATAKGLIWMDDPTNAESDYLRNWIRNDWLPALENKHQGGVQQLAKSIDRLLDQPDEVSNSIHFSTGKVEFSRLWFFGLSTKDQLKVLSISLQHFEAIEFSVGNLQEINKRLDKNQKEHIFTELGLNWVLNAQQIMIRFVDI